MLRPSHYFREVSSYARALPLARKKRAAQCRPNRSTRLTRTRVIKRFTVEFNAPETNDLLRAMMMIEVRGNTANLVQKALQRMSEITLLHRTCGVWDLVVGIETTNLVDFDGILARIRELPGVSNSKTCPLLRQIG